jgi:hypothetical protein
MRQNTPRRPPGKPADTATTRLKMGAGDHLDLGMTVSVYCAGTARRQKGDEADGAFVPPDIIEH